MISKKVCRTLIYFENFISFILAVSGCVSVSAFTSLTDSSAVEIKVYAITAAIKK